MLFRSALFLHSFNLITCSFADGSNLSPQLVQALLQQQLAYSNSPLLTGALTSQAVPTQTISATGVALQHCSDGSWQSDCNGGGGSGASSNSFGGLGLGGVIGVAIGGAVLLSIGIFCLLRSRSTGSGGGLDGMKKVELAQV